MRLECMGSRPRCQVMAMEHVEDLPVRGGMETERNSASGSTSSHCSSSQSLQRQRRRGSHRRLSGARSYSMACM